MPDKQVKNIIIDQLTEFNVKNIYSYAGDTILQFYSALKNSPLNLYTTRHESTAGLMASAEAKLTGNLAVCVAHSGPGTANIINGIADAAIDRAPLLLITGQVPTYNLNTKYKQMVKHQQLTNPLTVYSATLVNPASVVDLLYTAMTKALIRGGVSHIVIPMDMWDTTTGAEPRAYPQHLEQKLIPEDKIITEAAETINKAQKPVILYGRGMENNRDTLTELANKIQAPLINSLPAAGLVSFENEYNLGGLGFSGNKQASSILKQSDLIIILGTTWWPMDYTPRAPEVIQIDACRENIALTHPVNIGITGNLDIILSNLMGKIIDSDKSNWVDTYQKARNKWLEDHQKSIRSEVTEGLIEPAYIIDILSNYIAPEEIISLDSGDNVIWFGKYFSKKCHRVLLSGTWRTMGFGLPAALAARLNNPDTPVTCITGDGGLTMVLPELLTAADYEIPVRIIVLNNRGLVMEKNRMKAAELQLTGVSLNNPDFASIAESCGIKGIKIDKPGELDTVFTDTAQLSVPTLIDIPTADTILPGTKL